MFAITSDHERERGDMMRSTETLQYEIGHLARNSWLGTLLHLPLLVLPRPPRPLLDLPTFVVVKLVLNVTTTCQGGCFFERGRGKGPGTSNHPAATTRDTPTLDEGSGDAPQRWNLSKVSPVSFDGDLHMAWCHRRKAGK